MLSESASFLQTISRYRNIFSFTKKFNRATHFWSIFHVIFVNISNSVNYTNKEVHEIKQRLRYNARKRPTIRTTIL